MQQLTISNQENTTLVKLALINMPKGTTEQEAASVVEREINNLKLIFSMRPELTVCSPNSVIQAIKQCINDNLTFAPSNNLVYVYPDKVWVGMDGAGQKTYETVLAYKPTSNGVISLSRQAGRILDIKRPEIIYTADNAVQWVIVEYLLPSIPEPRWEQVKFGVPHFEKWKTKSANKFGGKANTNYTSWFGGIDPDFAATKAIRHALSKLGTNINERVPFLTNPPENARVAEIPVQSVQNSNELPNPDKM